MVTDDSLQEASDPKEKVIPDFGVPNNTVDDPHSFFEIS